MRCAPSKPEGLILAGVALILLSIAVPGVLAFRNHRREARVRGTLRAIMDAGARFNAEYGAWPSGRVCAGGDCRFGGEWHNREVIHVLRAADGVGNKGHGVNTHRIVFLDPPASSEGRCGVDTTGDYVDAWGVPFQFVLDTDLSGACVVENSIYGRVEAGMIAWSCGPDGASDTADDILSWRR